MHHALEINEILCHIFDHFSPPITRNTYDPDRVKATSTLAALVRTCRTFKEPALDALWRGLVELSPLARCLPETCRRSSQGRTHSFTRPLMKTEWDILKSYTSRVRCIMNFNVGLDWSSVEAFLYPPTTEPLFPNLRNLRCGYTEKTMALLRLPLPSLVNLDVWFEDPRWFLDSFPTSSPNITTLSVRLTRLEDAFSRIEHKYVSRWQNLSSVACSQVALDMNDLIRLSRMPALTRLDFALKATLPASDSLLVFSKLRNLTLHSESLDPISQLLSQIRIPAIMTFSTFINNCPSGHDLTSFSAGIATSNVGSTLELLRLTQSSTLFGSGLPCFAALPLGFEELQPWMAFSNLRRVELNVSCDVSLTDDQVLALASAWPKLKCLLLNEDWGWNARGITPGGLVRLLQTCPSLTRIALRLDTQGYTKVPPNHVPARLGLTLSPAFSMDFLDSVIEAEAVTAVATFLYGLAACCERDFSFSTWSGARVVDFQRDEHVERWDEVVGRVNGALGRSRKY